MEKYECTSCNLKYWDKSGPTDCLRCGNVYVKCITYFKNSDKTRKDRDKDG